MVYHYSCRFVTSYRGSNKNQHGRRTPDSVNRLWEVYVSLCGIFKVPLFIPRVHGEMARKIIDKVSINAEDDQGRTLLMLACLDNKQDIVEFLLESYGKEVNIGKSDSIGNTALHYACLGARPSLINKLLTKMTNKDINDIKKANQEGLTAVDIALRNGKIYAAEIVTKELMGETIVKSPGCNVALPKLFITAKQCTSNELLLERRGKKSTEFPSVSRATSNESANAEAKNFATQKPASDPRRNSKTICSYLLTLLSVQDTDTYRQGFPLVSEQKRQGTSRTGSFSSSYCALSAPASQTGIESRRGSSHRGSLGVMGKQESSSSSSKSLRTPIKLNRIRYK